MADQTQKPQGTFAKLMSSTLPQQEQKGEKPESKKARNLVSQHASKLESQESGKPENWQGNKTKVPDHKVSTEKVTYRFHAEGKYAVEDMKTILARKHNIKTSLEEIAEESILLAYEDLLENQYASLLACRLASKQANKKSS